VANGRVVVEANSGDDSQLTGYIKPLLRHRGVRFRAGRPERRKASFRGCGKQSRRRGAVGERNRKRDQIATAGQFSVGSLQNGRCQPITAFFRILRNGFI